ncbi:MULTISPECIES: glutamine--fructose-6-phosphate transaminase (isomerizing) [Aerococcus]|uniref:Glutamine--fructose-6-phosphate aminotransferase [isomerizing] n=1 Tax=Aerococcus urinae TaxID=1376 RepID=A0A329NYN0_9LACT|nr:MULTISPECIES: glutamine--fructose-6-phosphate transaminase (isomerizing) [Aerococcus]MDK6728191.1 glutamine--fructose-6-phosphate transaminase (isomerizing) [Aerococcus urinae]RAV80389.1 glutamine--fructose-6-phosphate transaminase (isomerizing) [Aerococcus loyolae]
MCGIVGFIGENAAQEVLLKGLERLEYRGYDSAGIYVVDEEDQGHLFKVKGRIAQLLEEVDLSIPAHLGIGHTRWATHGVPSVPNAHPHLSHDGRFALVHNGVIENYQALKNDYLADVDFYSDTDTEVVVELLAKFSREENLDALSALRKTVGLLEGSYALGLIDTEDPDHLYAAKNKSPLLIGKGQGFNTIASDAMASIAYTDQYIEIHDGELVTLSKDQVEIENLAGEVVSREPYTASLDADDLEKGTYDYYMEKEIVEQPAAIRKIIQAYEDDKGQLNIDHDLVEAIADSDRIFIVAAGTSMHAGLVGKVLLERIAKVPTEVHVASEFSYNPPLLPEKPFFIYLTQSGETADSRQVLVQTNAQGYPSLTITNVPGSTLSREADYTLLLHVGPEIAVASTKAYTGQITVLAIIADQIARKKGLKLPFDLKHELSIVAQAMDEVVGQADYFHQLATDYFKDQRSAFYIGRGLDYAVSVEAALKLKEVSYIQTEGFASGELKHGTISLIEDGVPVVAIISQANTALLTRGNVEETRSRGAHNLIIAMEGLDQEGDQIVLPHVHDLLTPLITVIPAQLLAYYATIDRGLDVDKPRNLAKSVTVE